MPVCAKGVKCAKFPCRWPQICTLERQITTGDQKREDLVRCQKKPVKTRHRSRSWSRSRQGQTRQLSAHRADGVKGRLAGTVGLGRVFRIWDADCHMSHPFLLDVGKREGLK